MEVESRSEGMPASEALLQTWRRAWVRAKTVAMVVEVMLVQSQKPWAEAWTSAWAEAQAEYLGAQGRVEGAWEWEWAKERAQRERALVWALGQELVRAEAMAKAQVQALVQATARVKGLQLAQAQARGWEPSQVQVLATITETRAKIADLEAKSAEAQVKTVRACAYQAEVQAQIAEAGAKAEAEALAVAGAWVWARGQAREKGERIPAEAADPSTIWHTLTSLNRSGVARDLWDRSPETRLEYSSIIRFIAPITRLPFELLHEIFLIIIDEANGPPVVLMLICKHWYAIVTSIWAPLNLGTRTPLSAVTSKLERSHWFLDVVVDTDSDRGDFTPSDGAFEAIFAAIEAEASSRW